jgi:hypothetical protein
MYYDAPLSLATFRLPQTQLEYLDGLAATATEQLGVQVTRAEILRGLIDRAMEHGSNIDEARALSDVLDADGVAYDVVIGVSADGTARFRVEPKQLPAAA